METHTPAPHGRGADPARGSGRSDMTLVEAFVLGAVQGATEFLPVSSSGHLALFQSFMELGEGQLFFDVIVHVGTLVAIVVSYRARITALVAALLSGVGLRPANATTREDLRFVAMIAVASVPTGVIGLALKDLAESVMTEPGYVGPAFLVTALLLTVSERLGQRTRGGRTLGLLDAVTIGIAQGLAVIPGVSRSGATVATALVRDVDGPSAVEFSLLISIPAILGATLLTAIDAVPELGGADWVALGVGFVTAVVTGILAVRALQWAVGRRRLYPFAVYTGALGVVLCTQALM